MFDPLVCIACLILSLQNRLLLLAVPWVEPRLVYLVFFCGAPLLEVEYAHPVSQIGKAIGNT